MNRKITIVIPVYADWVSLKDCISSIKKCVSKKHKIMLINDSGPEANLLEKNIKKAIQGHKNFMYFRNANNLGFVKTCNRAVFELDRTDSDILLLNSDTKVTSGFLEEMMAVLHSSDNIGVVSPRSNNATIATVPLSSAPKKGIKPKKSYELFQNLKSKLPRYNEIPTALGFCMLIKRSVVKKFGLFDEVYGKGYGEENDFSMRIKQGGYVCVLANWAYVFHLEARSFTMKTKSELIKKNRAILDDRYPEYTRLVKDYIEEALLREEGEQTKPIAPRPNQVD